MDKLKSKPQCSFLPFCCQNTVGCLPIFFKGGSVILKESLLFCIYTDNKDCMKDDMDCIQISSKLFKLANS